MKTKPQKYLPYGEFITYILQKFNVHLDVEKKTIYDEINDYTTFKRMKLDRIETTKET